MRPSPARAAIVAELVASGQLTSAVADQLVQDGRVGDAAWARVRRLFDEEQRERVEDQVVPTEGPELLARRFEDLGIGPGDSDYTGYRYELLIGDRVFELRRYDDTPDRISFHDTGRIGEERGPIRGGVPYRDPLFARAVAYLVERLGVARIDVLTSDPEHPDLAYAPVDLSRLRC